ncbi:MAG: metalloprotease family protein [Candidatus Thermoplasmatota archaeon]|nr:metalloprotease family protein [Candidatus Thermoplasmatota archaeon]
MDIILKILIGFVLAFLLHELTHLLVIVYYKLKIKSIIITKWTTVGFLLDNEQYINNKKILSLLHLLPLIWCLFYLMDPSEPYLLMFPLVNLSGGVGDMYNFLKIILLSPEKRIEWANKCDEKILKSIIWKKELNKVY